MLTAFFDTSAYYFTGRSIYNYLAFYCVPFFLARIIPSLFFFGRSTGLSVTSAIAILSEHAEVISSTFLRQCGAIIFLFYGSTKVKRTAQLLAVSS